MSFPMRRVLTEIMEPHIDPVLFRLSRDYVGDTAETVALLWRNAPDRGKAPRLSEVVEALKRTSRRELPRLVASLLDQLDANGRWALLKFLGGALRVGVSARLAKIALAEGMGARIEEIEEVWHGLAPPYTDLFQWLEGNGPRPDPGLKPVFRPVMLAHPIEDEDWAGLRPEDFVAEWKWDGIRVQIASVRHEVRVFSRAGDDISSGFPDVVEAFHGRHGVLDGELLVVESGQVKPFNDLQQRLNRKSVTERMIQEYPAYVRLYDILFDGPEDLETPALHRKTPKARGLVHAGQTGSSGCERDRGDRKLRGAQSLVERCAREGHRRADAEAAGEPLSGGTAQRSLV